MSPSSLEIAAAVLFGLALLHTFSTRYFERLAHTRPTHAGVWHLLAEVEIVFGFWAMVLVLFMAAWVTPQAALTYLDGRNFTEPLFVFAIMVVAASRPVLQLAAAVVQQVAKILPMPAGMAFLATVLTVVPLLGSFITEPAAMTLAALLLRDTLFTQASQRLKYAILGTLFVNVSIGGTLTPFAAPPVLMVASRWGLDLAYMLQHIGWKAMLAVFINAGCLLLWFAQELRVMRSTAELPYRGVPAWLVAVHLLFLCAIVLFAHHPAAFLAVFLLFMGIATAYPAYQEQRLILREALLVAFFLGGLVVLGGMQQWWLQPLLLHMNDTQIFWGATALTAITDNAALTYLGSLVEGLSAEFQYALLTGAVTGGGLTLIANAPNPAGASILKGQFEDGAISAFGLLVGALWPTLVAATCFRLFPL